MNLLFSAGKRQFREFLRSEYSEENMLFYLACEDLKKESNPELVEEKARLIYEDYISILSPKEVSYCFSMELWKLMVYLTAGKIAIDNQFKLGL